MSFYHLLSHNKKGADTTLYADIRSKISSSLTRTLTHAHAHTHHTHTPHTHTTHTTHAQFHFGLPPSAALCSLINILISRKDEDLILINRAICKHGEMRREQIIFPDTSYIIRLTLSNALFTMQNAVVNNHYLNTHYQTLHFHKHCPKSQSLF